MAKIVVLSDIDTLGSGYKYIMVPLLTGLANLGHEIKVAGLSYRGEEHHYPFSVIPANDLQDGVGIINNLHFLWKHDIVLVALDIPLQLQVFETLKPLGKPYIAITPLENGPLTMSWAAGLFNMNYVFFISELGKQEAQKAGLFKVDHLQVGVDTKSWRPALPDEKSQIRKNLGIGDDEFVVLTVAENQERKNLSAGMEIIARLKKDCGEKKVRYLLVTREHSPFGWKLRDLAVRLDINKEVNIYERGMSRENLWGLYAASDAYLSTSKAEGLCVLPDVNVWTDKGLFPIQNVSKGDYVFTDTGDTERVEKVFSREVDEDINVINLGFGLEPIKATKNHPILSVKVLGREWVGLSLKRKLSNIDYVPAQSIKKGDYIFYPKPKESSFDRLYIDDYVDDVRVDNGIVYSLGRNQFGSEFIHPSSKNSSLKNEVIIDEGFCSLLGWYIAEGCDTKEGLSFSLNSNEISYREHIRRLLKSKFGLELHDNFRDRNRYDGRVYGRVLGNLFSSLGGHDATTKHLPEWSLFLDENLSWSLLEAMFCGDGTFSSKDATLRYSTTSKTLSRQLQFILFRLGIVSSVRDSKNRLEYVVTIHRPEIFKIPFLKNEYIPKVNKIQSQFIELDTGWLLPVRSNTVKHYVGKVYNLDVANRHNYLLAGGIVHNCLPVLDAMAAGIPAVATDTGALTELLQDERGHLVKSAYDFYDVWGNSLRRMIDVDDAVKNMRCILETDCVHKVKALEFVRTKTWDIPVQQVHKVLENVLNEQR